MNSKLQNDDSILSLSGITKTYPGVKALNNVSLSFRKGEVHALMGENGAGKSTLIKTIAGAITPNEGTITFENETFEGMNPHLSRKLGIEVVYQEFNLVEPLTAAENIFLGEKRGKLIDWKFINNQAEELFKKFNININPNTPVRDLTSAQQQIVEISKAVSKNAKVLILDEPTAPLTVTETNQLFKIIETLKANGTTILYISHRLDEIFAICDRVSVLRDGTYVATRDIKDTSRKDLIALMVGRELTETYPPRPEVEYNNPALEVKNLTTEVVKNVTLTLNKGEILGLSGLIGSGRTETARGIFGADEKSTGQIFINGKEINISMPKDAINNGVGLIPEDRKRQGVFLKKDILWNSSIVNICNISKYCIVDKKEEINIANEYVEKLKIRTPGINQNVGNLSGGNQQKVALAKTLASNSEIIIFDEPSRGIDVGARYEIYLLMNELTSEGKSILMITSDMEELLGMSDRVLVFHEGAIAGELQKNEFSQTKILELASGETQ